MYRRKSSSFLYLILSVPLAALCSQGLAAVSERGKLLQGLNKLRPEFLRLGGPALAYNHLECFVDKYSQRQFEPIQVKGALAPRCNQRSLEITNTSSMVIIDYTAVSDTQRLYLLDLKNQKLHRMAVSHGRFGETPRSNTKLSDRPRRNSVLSANHFSNVIGQNATAGGFYITGKEYQGSYGRSLVLHGIETGINDNACARAVVIHPSVNVGKTKAHVMSSGCPMVSPQLIDLLVSKIRNGAIFYHFTPDEERMAADQCGRKLRLRTGPIK